MFLFIDFTCVYNTKFSKLPECHVRLYIALLSILFGMDWHLTLYSCVELAIRITRHIEYLTRLRCSFHV